MKVFLNIGDFVALDADVPFDKDELEQELLNRARSYYEDVVDDNEAYIPDSVEIECLGCQDQQALIKQAKSWNNEIQSEFYGALASVMEETAKLGSLPRDTQATYRLRKAVCELDNTVYAFGEHMNCVGGDYAKVVLTDPQLFQIIGEPQNYAVISVYPK